jgi:hypothetical protein
MLNHHDPSFRKSDSPLHSAFQLSYETALPFFGEESWLTRHPQEALSFALASVFVFVFVFRCELQ